MAVFLRLMHEIRFRRYSAILAVLTGLLLWPQGVQGKDDVEGLLKQAEAAQAAQQYEQAMKLLQQAIQLDPKNADSYCQLGNALYYQKNLDAAIAAYRKAIELNPQLAQTYYNLGVALSEQKNLDAAIVAYRKAIELNPQFADVYNNLGVVLSNQENLEVEIAACRKAIELNSQLAYAYYNLGNALSDQKNLDEAIAAYRKAIELNPRDAAVYNNLGIALYNQKNLDTAIASYRKAIELNPQYAEAYNNLGIVLKDQRNLDAAIVAYRKAIELNPQDAAVYNNLGIALYNQRNLDAAIASYRKAIELNPQYAEAYSNLGTTLSDQKDLDAAIASYRKAIELNPQLAQTYYNLGNAFSDQNDLDAAIAAYRKVLSLPEGFGNSSKTKNRVSTYVVAHNGLGLVYQTQGNLEAAKREFEAALKIDPNYEFAKNNLTEVLKLINQPTVLAYADTRYLNRQDPLTATKRSVVLLTPVYNPDGRGGAATGFIVKREGNKLWIVTNRHVVTDKWNRQVPRTADSVEIQLFLGNKPSNVRSQPLTGKVLNATDDKSPDDVALVTVEALDLPADIQPLRPNFTPSNQLPVTVIGHPSRSDSGNEQDTEWAKDSGTLINQKADQLTLDVSLKVGNSGSPILDPQDHIIGMISDIGEKETGYAVPIQKIVAIIKSWGVNL